MRATPRKVSAATAEVRNLAGVERSIATDPAPATMLNCPSAGDRNRGAKPDMKKRYSTARPTPAIAGSMTSVRFRPTTPTTTRATTATSHRAATDETLVTLTGPSVGPSARDRY